MKVPQKLQEFVNREYSKHTIYPPKTEVLRALKLTSLKDTKIIILGQDPYHGPSQANGLAFAVNNGIKIPPSLRNIFKKKRSLLFPVMF